MAKTKAEIKGLDIVKKDVKTFINNIIKEKPLLEELGKMSADAIKNQTRGRRGEYKQKELKEVTIQARDIYSEHYTVDKDSSPKTSNLTLTGQLLNSIKYKVNQASGLITIYFNDNRKDRAVNLDKSIINKERDRILDKDFNATNKKGDPKLRARLSALYMLTNKKNKDQKTNSEIVQDLDQRGFKFFFISVRLKAQLESKIKSYLRTKLSNYKKLKRSLK
jgi:hypothetical protein